MTTTTFGPLYQSGCWKSNLSIAQQMAQEKFTIHNDGEQAVKQRLETLVACGDNLVKHLQNKQRDRREHDVF